MALKLVRRGPPGADGASFLIGTATPDPSLGKNGDVFWNYATGGISKKEVGSWNGKTSLKAQPGRVGDPGPPGNSILFGTSPPLAEQGRVGDYFLYKSPWGAAFYGPRGQASWPSTSDQLVRVITGAGPPSSNTGLEGQIYFDTDNVAYYGPKGSGGWSAATALVGLIFGTGAPSNSVGLNGQSYIDKAGQVFYGPKASGAWPAGQSFAGAVANWVGGNWAGSTTYVKNDGVSYAGASYVSLQNSNTNHQPDTSPAWWQLVAARGAVGSVSIAALPSSTDLNTITAVGIYDVQNPTNGPGAGYWYVETYPSTASTDYVMQRATFRDTGAQWVRVRVAGTWGSWGKSATTAEVTSATSGLTQDVTFAVQDIRGLALMVAELKGDRLNMMDGIADPLNDLSDIVTGSSSGYTQNQVYHGTNSLSTTSSIVPTSTGSSVSSPGSSSPASAFDTDYNSAWSASPATGSYLGWDFGAGNSKSVRTIYVYNNSTDGSSVGYTASTVVAEYSDNLTTWTQVGGSFALVDQFGGVNILVLPGVGAHRAWRVRATGASTNGPWLVSRMQFYTVSAIMTLVSAAFPSDIASPTKARLVVQVTSYSDTTITLNTDLIASISRNGGTNFTAGTLTFAEQLADGTRLYETAPFDISGQPAGSSIVWKVATANSKDVGVSGIVAQWRP